MKRYLLLALFLALLLASPAMAAEESSSVDVVFSNLEASEIRVSQTGMLQLILSDEDGEVVAEKTIDVDTPGTKIVGWNVAGESGRYRVDATLTGDGVVASDSYGFLYGGQGLPRFHLKEVSVDSRGYSVLLQAFEPSIADVEVMLVRDNNVIAVQRSGRVAVVQPVVVEDGWNVLLEDDTEYRVWVKATQRTPQTSTAGRLVGFTAREDVGISDVYVDETGASATITGESQVPYDGRIRFTVDGEKVSVEGPPVLAGEDETIEVQWSERLPAGRHRVQVTALSSTGETLDKAGTILDAEAPPATPTPTPTAESPAPGMISLLGVVLVVYWLLR